MTRMVPPKQRRSREAVDRVLDATDRLMAERAFSDISVVDICVEADVSVSSLYARFPTKDDILATLFERHVTVAKSATEATLAEAMERGENAEVIARVVLGAFVSFVREHGSLMHSIYSDDKLNEPYWRLSSEVLDSLVVLVQEAYQRHDVEFERVAKIGGRIAGAAIQRALGIPMTFGERIGISDAELVNELASMLIAYWNQFVATHPVPD